MSVWTQGLPRMPTMSASRPRAGARLEVDGTKTNDTWIRILGALPQELLDQIRGMCPESCLWRYFSALERFPHLEPLLDRDTKTRWVSFEELGSWNRWDSVMSTSGSADLVRLSLDDFGIRSVEHKSDTDEEGTSPDSGIGYVVEHADTMKSFKCAIKVRGSYQTNSTRMRTLMYEPGPIHEADASRRQPTSGHGHEDLGYPESPAGGTDYVVFTTTQSGQNSLSQAPRPPWPDSLLLPRRHLRDPPSLHLGHKRRSCSVTGQPAPV